MVSAVKREESQEVMADETEMELGNGGIITFIPPVCEQRYVKVYSTLNKLILESGTDDSYLKTIMEVGCAELRFHRYVRHVSSSVRKIIYLDKDEEVLKNVSFVSSIPILRSAMQYTAQISKN